jgi:putative nucleotidyltransferase with HDIG domain
MRWRGAPSHLPASRWLWAGFFFASLVPLTLMMRVGAPVPALQTGTIADFDVVAPFAVELVDPASEPLLRAAAAAAVPTVLDVDPLAAATSVRMVETLFRGGEEAEASRAAIPVSTRAYLEGHAWDPGIRDRLLGGLQATHEHPIVTGRILLPTRGGVLLRDARTGGETPAALPLGESTQAEAGDRVLEEMARRGAPAEERRAIAPLLSAMIAPSLTVNTALTEARRAEAMNHVTLPGVRIAKGTVVVRRGEQVTEPATRLLSTLARQRAGRLSLTALAGDLLFLALLLFFLQRYVFLYQKAYRRERTLFALMVVVLVGALFLDAGFLWLFARVALGLRAGPFGDPTLYQFMVPLATGSVLITLLVNPRAGMAFALFYAPMLGLLMEWDLRALLFGLLSNLAGIYGITVYRRRAALLRAGLLLGAINALTVLALRGVGLESAPTEHLPFQMLCGFAGGIVTSILVSFLLPLLESAFNILTDVRLLELSNLENPLLRRLALESPGSYHHSITVGTLAESAAEAIGANALFCRVAALYHDVGKMLKPTYFVENQKGGDNRHDRLSPHLSARVIASHVRDGIELARSHGVPPDILDVIPQHHGTRRINFFFQKARRGGPSGAEAVRESDFRYPGPRPQTREAALIMLADSIEAAARSLDDPIPARLKGVVNTIVSDVVLDDQFSECDLSFSDLERVRAAFFRTLCSIHHHRIDYPGFDFDKVAERPFRASPTHAAAGNDA